MIAIEIALVAAAVLLLFSILASKVFDRLGIPALLLFLVIGMLAGSEGPGGIYFDDPFLAQSLGVVALAFILFSGGLDTDWRAIRPVLWAGLSLSTLGVLISAVLVGLFATLVLHLSLLEGMLLGAIVSSTDTAAVFGILRARGVALKERLRTLIELESGTNDPMAVFLTIGLISLIANEGASLLGLVPLFFVQMAVGGIVGYTMGRGMVLLVNRLRLGYEGLYPVLTVALVALTYGAATLLNGNGFVAVYLAGLVMGNRDFVHKRSLLRFHDGVGWLMQIAMFLTLGLLVFPSRLVPVAGTSLLIAAFLMVVARPASVFIALLPIRISLREKLMISWIGLRGAVPIILATFPLLAGLPQADMFFNLVFFIVLTSVLLQGPLISRIARWLRVQEASPQAAQSLVFVPAVSVNSRIAEMEIPIGSPLSGRSIMDLGLPAGALVVLIQRSRESLVPSGATVLRAGDELLVLADPETLEEVRALLHAPLRAER